MKKAADSQSIVLHGLNGSIPVDFLAALGVLVLLTRFSRLDIRPTLAWTSEAEGFRPVLHSLGGFSDVFVAASAARNRFRDELGGLTYVKMEKNGPKRFRGLRPPLAVFREWLVAHSNQDDLWPVRHASALCCETVVDKVQAPSTPDHLKSAGIGFDSKSSLESAVRQTAFDFTCRNEQFLDQIIKLGDLITEERLRSELLLSVAMPDKTQVTLHWELSATTPAAVVGAAKLPSRGSVEWLAFWGLGLLPVFGRGNQIKTTACIGQRRSAMFVWPTWSDSLPVPVVSSLLSHAQLKVLSHAKRARLGIIAVFESRLGLAADGYTGMFSPTCLL